jgi:hypothetical protein
MTSEPCPNCGRPQGQPTPYQTTCWQNHATPIPNQPADDGGKVCPDCQGRVGSVTHRVRCLQEIGS